MCDQGKGFFCVCPEMDLYMEELYRCKHCPFVCILVYNERILDRYSVAIASTSEHECRCECVCMNVL